MADCSMLDITVPTLMATPRIPAMPENIWLDIFGHLSLQEKFRVSSTCRTWHRILADPSLYTHLDLDHMEFNTLVKWMQQLCRLAPRIRSLRISNCYSLFISKTTVPVQNTSMMMHHFSQQSTGSMEGMGMGMHSLYSHITSFTPPRRKEEYRKLGFTLHQEFSEALVALMKQSQESIKRLEIQDNFLDLEMTDLVFCIVRYGRHLEHLLYDANKDGGFIAPEVVSAITAACPNIRSFRGQHAISDTVLQRIMTGWQELRSITLAPYQSPTLGTREISPEGLWSLLEGGKVESLELLDLDCISNEGLLELLQKLKQRQALSFADHYHHHRSPTSPVELDHPLAHLTRRLSISEPQDNSSTIVPGASVRHLTVTKYTSSPITLPGFRMLFKLFPNLETLKFTTNFFTYDHRFQGLTREIYEEEIRLVENMIREEMSDRWPLPSLSSSGSSELVMPPCWIGEWHAPLTEEQRLRVGIIRPSSSPLTR